MTLKCHGNFGGKLSPGFQFSPEKNLPIWFKQQGWVKISNFIGTLVQSKTVTGVYHPVTLKGLKKFVGKLTPGFQFSPDKNLPILFQQSRWIFFSKRYMGSVKNFGKSFILLV